MTFDLAIAHKWIFDLEFTACIEKMFQEKGLSTFLINMNNVDEVTALVRSGKLKFKAILDRASDEDENFTELAQLLSKSDTYIINEYKKVDTAIDKAKMHKVLIENNFPVPETIIVPPFDVVPEFKLTDNKLAILGSPFVIKPGFYSGGGEGVVLDAKTEKDIHKSRIINHDDNYLIQRRVYPKLINNKRAWFRVFCFFNSIVPLWWDDKTHIFSYLSESDKMIVPIKRITDYTTRLAELSGLDYFSSEFTIDENDNFYIIDYINDQCDMRMKSKHVDGVPDEVVRYFISTMIEKVRTL